MPSPNDVVTAVLARLRPARVLALSLGLCAGSGLAAEPGDGAAIPDVALSTLRGELVTLADVARGRPMVVNLWATWCPPCREEMPLLALAQQRETGVSFVFVNQGESDELVRRYLHDEILALDNVLLDPASSLRRAVGSKGLPTTMFYDGAGRLVRRHVGLVSRQELATMLRLLRPDGAAGDASRP